MTAGLDWNENLPYTDPTNSASSLKLSLSINGPQATLSFGAASNKTYSVQYADQPNGGSWSKLILPWRGAVISERFW